MISVNDKTIIFDMFIKNNILYMISTYYNKYDPPITIKVNGIQVDESGYNEYEPVRCFSTRAPLDPNIELEICGTKIPVTVRIVESKQPSGIGIATLFKYDAYRIPDFINYYKKQGVTYFWFYYNGSELPLDLPQGENINYRLWNYKYFNEPQDYISRWGHCAQTAFLTLCNKLYLPDVEWLILNDLDEWIYHENTTIAVYLKNISEDRQIVQIRNHWAKRKNNEIKYSLTYNDFNIRSKCIYRNTYKDYFGIHSPKTNKLNLIQRDVNLKILHIRDEGGAIAVSHDANQDKLIPPVVTLVLKDYTLIPLSN